MGKSKRGSITNEAVKDLPGPGRYDSPSKMGTGPSFKLGGKYADLLDDGKPGPGAYNASRNLLVESVKSYTLGKSGRS